MFSTAQIKIMIAVFLILYVFILFMPLSRADVYPNDDFSIHKLCVGNPWVSQTNGKYQGDATSAFPCHYDYAIVHTPTLQAEFDSAIATGANPNLTPQIFISLQPADAVDVAKVFSLFFGFTLSFLLFVFLLGRVVRFIWTGGRSF